MFSFLFGLLLGSRGVSVPKPLRIALFIFIVGLVIVVTIFTLYVVATLPERTTGHHVQPHHLN